jgi:isocitrate lyase
LERRTLAVFLHTEPFVNALGALTGNQAVQQVKAGLKVIYFSGWQVAADATLARQMYPDQSLCPANSMPGVVKRINNALVRADQIYPAERFAAEIHAQFPDKPSAYDCSQSFNWKAKLDDATIAKFPRELGKMGDKFQFITRAGFHALNFSMFKLAESYRDHQMAAYVELQTEEFAAEARGYTATRHQRKVGAGYLDDVTQTVSGGTASTAALTGSTEESQF